MTQIRATLIQNIFEFREYLQEYLYKCFEEYRELNEDEVLKWIICEELEEVNHLFDASHIHNRTPHIHIRNMLRGTLPVPLSEVFSWYIKAPKIYNENNEIQVILKGRDLYINYYTDFHHFVRS